VAPASVGSALPSTTAETTISEPKPLGGKQEATKGQSLFGRAEKSSSSTHETPTPGTFSFGLGKGSAAAPSPLFGAPLRPVETGSPSAEPTTKKAKVPKVSPADSKAPAK